MDFAEQITRLVARANDQAPILETEEATKNALVMPFISALGYDVFDPTEVVPEFTADVGIKKGEKVDYAVVIGGTPRLLFECKCAGHDLSTDHASQLYRYFSVTDARIGVLTNGVEYRFFSDLESENKMDERPFLEVDLLDLGDEQVEELQGLCKSSFDLGEILSAAHDLKYSKALRTYLARQWAGPDEDFTRFMTKRVYDGMVTQRVREQFTGIVRQALHQFVSDKVSGRLKSALMEEEAAADEERDAPQQGDGLPEGVVARDGEITTTEDEMEGYRIVRAIMREVVDVERIAARDVKTYFGVLLDDNNRQPICRLHFNTSQWYMSLFDKGREEEKVPIDTLDDIYDYADRLRATMGVYKGR